MKLLKINTETGMFIEDVILPAVPTVIVDEQTIPDPQYITTPCPAGFYWPRWDGEQWVDGRSQAEIDAILAEQAAYVPITPEERIAQLEQIIDAMLAGGV